MRLDFTTYKYLSRFIRVLGAVIHAVSLDFEGEPIPCHLAVGREVDDGQGVNVFGIAIPGEIASIGVL